MRLRNSGGVIRIGVLRIGLFVLMISALSACGVYSFKAGTISKDVKSISIDNIYNESGGGPPNLGQTFTEKFKSYYQQNSRLDIVKTNGDWQLEGKITGYQTSPVAPIGGDAGQQSSAANRLTIRVNVKFTNIMDEKANFEQAFSFFADYEQNTTLERVESELIQTISDQIVFDVFSKTASNW